MDEGGYGVPAKVGKVNMNGSNPIILLEDIERPEAITIDLDSKLLYFSAQYPSFVSSSWFHTLIVLCDVLWILRVR
jgi:low density lipoprotein-related protein 2